MLESVLGSLCSEPSADAGQLTSGRVQIVPEDRPPNVREIVLGWDPTKRPTETQLNAARLWWSISGEQILLPYREIVRSLIRAGDTPTKIEYSGPLFHADPACDHHVYIAESGVKCLRCAGWFCA
jgi:hypothetical protein